MVGGVIQEGFYERRNGDTWAVVLYRYFGDVCGLLDALNVV